MEDELKRLSAQVEQLQSENAYLKRLLDEAGIPYTFHQAIIPMEITRQLARRFYSYFWGRTDVYSKRSVNKSTGKTGYYPQCENLWKDGLCPKKAGKKVKCGDCTNRKWRKLEAEQIMAHLRGEKPDGSDVIGIYPLFPDGTCRFLVFDFDNHEKGAEALDFGNTDNSWMEEVDALRQVCATNGIPCLVERSRSGRGGHLWVFFDRSMEAGLIRRFGMALLEKGAETVNLKSFRFYDRMLPAQTSIGDGELGYLIALPLQGQALKNGNSAFVDACWEPFADQWGALFATQRLSAETIDDCIKKWNVAESSQDSFLPEETKPWERTRKFHKEDADGQLRLTLANRIYIETATLKPDCKTRFVGWPPFKIPCSIAIKRWACLIFQIPGSYIWAKMTETSSAFPEVSGMNCWNDARKRKSRYRLRINEQSARRWMFVFKVNCGITRKKLCGPF